MRRLSGAFDAGRAPGLEPRGPTPQALVRELKKAFTVADIKRRGTRVLELAVRHGATVMRAYVRAHPFCPAITSWPACPASLGAASSA